MPASRSYRGLQRWTREAIGAAVCDAVDHWQDYLPDVASEVETEDELDELVYHLRARRSSTLRHLGLPSGWRPDVTPTFRESETTAPVPTLGTADNPFALRDGGMSPEDILMRVVNGD